MNTNNMIQKMIDGINHQAQTEFEETIRKAKETGDQLSNKEKMDACKKMDDEEREFAKQLENNKFIRLSIARGKQNMKLLCARNDVIELAMKEAEGELEKYSKTEKYKETLFNLCVQGMISLDEPKLEFAVRACDAEYINNNLQKIQDEYKNRTGNKTEVKLSDYVVPDHCLGGVVLIGRDGEIQMSNTFRDRLHLARSDLYPEIRKILLKENKSK